MCGALNVFEEARYAVEDLAHYEQSIDGYAEDAAKALSKAKAKMTQRGASRSVELLNQAETALKERDHEKARQLINEAEGARWDAGKALPESEADTA